MFAANAAGRIVLNVPDVIKLEQEIAAAGTPLAELMQRAGKALANAAAHQAEEMNGRRILVLCGYGNNGGDGWVAARHLADAGFNIDLATPAAPADLKAQPARDAALEAQAALDAFANARILVDPSTEELEAVFIQADVIVDAILGTGFSGDAVRAPFSEWIALANAQRARKARIVAADVPSGLSAQAGKAAAPCMKADKTVTMITSKPGLETPYAFAFCGSVEVAPLAPIQHILDAWERQAQDESGAEPQPSPAPERKNGRPGVSAKTAVVKDEFHRPEAEDDDGYDPYSDRRPEPEPLFQKDPWA